MAMRESMNLARRLPGFRRGFVLGAGSGAIAGLLAIAQAPLLAVIVDGTFFRHQGLRQLQSSLTLWLALLVTRVFFAWASSYSLSHTAVQTKGELRRRLTHKLILLSPANGHTTDTGDLTNIVGSGVDGVEGFLTKYLPQVVYVSTLPFAALLVVYRFDFISGLIFTATGPLIVIFMILIGKSTQNASQRRWKSQSILSGHFLDTLRGLTTLKLFNRSRRQVEVVRQLSQQYREETMKTLRVAFLSSFVLELFATLSTAMVAVAIGLRLISGNLTFVAGLTVLVLAGEFFLPLRNMGSEFHTAMNGISGLTRVFEILDQPLPWSRDENAISSLKTGKSVQRNDIKRKHDETFLKDDYGCLESFDHGRLAPKLTLEQVSFRHRDSDRPALSNLSLSMLPGTMTAVVGPSGAGKSTLLNLLMGFTIPENGHIRVNDVPLDETWVKDWRKRVMYIPQHPYLFQGSIMDNVRFANPSASEDQILAAAKKSGVAEMVATMQSGYDTIVGVDGYGLSGGQVQRIAIARAFLHGGDVLLMDEPSAHLDLQSEQWLRSALEELRRGRTTFMIAHRLSTIAGADRVVVLSDGHAVQSGTPQQLLQSEGPYRNLVNNYAQPQQEMMLS